MRFLELEEAGQRAIQRLGEVFLQQGVAAMQEELHALAEEWQQHRLEDEPTGELEPAGGDGAVLPDTAAIARGWAEPGTDGAIPPEPAPASAAAPPAAAAAEELSPAPPPEASVAAEAARRPRRGAGWLGALALLAAGGAFLGWLRLGGDGPSRQRRGGRRARGAAAAGGDDGEAASRLAAPEPRRGIARRLRIAAGRLLERVARGAVGDALARRRAALGLVPPLARRIAAAPRGAAAAGRAPRLSAAAGDGGLAAAAADPVRVPPCRGGDELRVVLDLASPEVSVRRVESVGLTLRVLLGADEPRPPRPLDLPSGTAQ